MTPGTLVIINLLGGVCLLLWGVRMVRTGIVRAWGDRLKGFIAHNLANRLQAAAAGAGATLLLQSGTATALIITGLAASGLIGAARGLSVLLGADVGSAIVSALFASGGVSLSAFLAPTLIFAGYVTHSVSNEFRPRNIGRILIGLGMMFLALKLVVTASMPLREASLFHQLLAAIAAEPVLAFITGALITWMSHSSLAVILITASLLASGSLGDAGALYVVLGINLGAGLPALLASAGQPPAARRMPLANLLCRGLCAILLLPLVPRFGPLLDMLVPDAVLRMVGFHAAFNLIVALLALPVTGPLMRLMEKAMPDLAPVPDNLAKPRYLNRDMFSEPGLALSQATLEVTRMTEVLDRMLREAMDALGTKSLEKLKAVKELDSRLNAYQREIQSYLGGLAQNELQPEESRQALNLMLYVSNLEHAGDVIILSLADRIKAKVKEAIDFTEAETAALNDLCGIVLDSLRLAASVVAAGEVNGARRLLQQKGLFRGIENQVIDTHFRGPLTQGKPLRRSALFVDLVRDLHTVNTHVTSAAYPIVEAAGLLRETRLRKDVPNP